MTPTRRGFTTLEFLASAVLLMVLASVTLQFLGSAANSRRAVERRALAIQEAANALERISAMPFGEVTSERLHESDFLSTISAIPGAIARVSVEAEADPPAKHVRVEITSPNAFGGSEAPVRLNCWLYPRPGASP